MEETNRIIFEKPDIPELVNKYTVVDMHFHTAYTDGRNSVNAIVRHVRKLGVGIAITDHNDIQGALDINRRRDILSIPGIEVTSSEGSHLLVYFYSIKDLKSFYTHDVRPYMGKEIMSSLSLPMEEIIPRARALNSLIVFPHPFCAAFTGICNYQFPPSRLNSLLELVDGVEVINAENINKWNLRCAVMGFNLNKSITGGSDGHNLHHLGSVVSFADCKKNRKSFLDSVKKKQNKVVGKEINILRKMRSNSLKLKSSIRNYPDLMQKNIRYGYSMINSKSINVKNNILRGRKKLSRGSKKKGSLIKK
jgi:predicted metal-dependent phosphoesterase TrpH